MSRLIWIYAVCKRKTECHTYGSERAKIDDDDLVFYVSLKVNKKFIKILKG